MREIPLSVPNLDSDIIENLKECIETGWVSTGGRFIGEFERKTADYLRVEDAASVQSGTAGLHLALRAAGVCAGDEVLVPALTFIAAVNPVRYQGAYPVFMDCNDSLCMDPEKMEAFLRDECVSRKGALINRKTGRAVKAVLVVHVFGNMADMDKIMMCAETYGIKVIEDATEALGTYYTEGRYRGEFAGTIGDFGVFSFNANKIITTGGGGMIVSKEKKDLERMRYLSLTAKDDPLYFRHDEVGYNYRMLNIQAALGVSQIDRLESFIEKKKANYFHYKTSLETADTEGLYRIMPFRDGTRPNYWFYSLCFHQNANAAKRDQLMNRLIEEGIQCRPVWTLASRQKPYLDCEGYRIDKAEHYEKSILNLPCSSSLSSEDVDFVASKIRKAYIHSPDTEL